MCDRIFVDAMKEGDDLIELDGTLESSSHCSVVRD